MILPSLAWLEGKTPHSLVQLAGDASDRTFSRLVRWDGESCVVMNYGPGHVDAIGEWLTIRGYLAARSLSVPAVIEEKPEAGVVLLEDLGDETLYAALDSDNARNWYIAALDLLAEMQVRCQPEASCPAFGRTFDVPKLMSELEAFLRYTVGAFHGMELEITRKQAILDEFRELCRRLDQSVKVFAHRDFHSRNLMVHRGQLSMVDFQDARLGDPCYDLASLIRDCYVVLQPDFRAFLMGYYFERVQVYYYKGWSIGAFQDHFELHALQRNLKAAASFGFLTKEKNKPQYAKYLPAAYTMVWDFLKDNDTWPCTRELVAELRERMKG